VDNLLELVNVKKSYQIRKDKIQVVLNDVNVSFAEKGFVSILGSSGNGKTTLLNIIGGLDTIDSGKVCFDQKEIKDFEKFRREKVGYVFQHFNLVAHLNAVDNVILSMGDHVKNKKEKAEELLIDMGLEECFYKLPKQLSGGQQQRIAIARMVAKDVDIIICDEPTGSLDEETEKNIVEIIKKLSKDRLVLFVTHSKKIANKYSDRIIVVKRGTLVEENSIENKEKYSLHQHKRSYKKNYLFLAKKSLKGRLKYTFKYLLLATFILLTASLAFILEGEFFKMYMHEEAIVNGINNMIFDVDEENLESAMDEIIKSEYVDHVTPNYHLTIGVAGPDLADTRLTTEVHVENITNNQYIEDIIMVGRYPENPSEVLMTPEGIMTLMVELETASESMLDEYMAGEVSPEKVYELVKWRNLTVREYGSPRIKVVGLLDETKIFESNHRVYYVDGFFDLFEYPGGAKANQIKVYKNDYYRSAEESIINSLDENIIVINEQYNYMNSSTYNHIDSFLQLSKITLYLVLVIAAISFLSLEYTSLFERKYEIGLYRSLGYSKGNIQKILASEMFIIGFIAMTFVMMVLSFFSWIAYINLDYYSSFIEILETLNIIGIFISLILILSAFIMVIIYTGNTIILRKSVISNINVE